jgi:hypothetical protein
MQVRLIQTMNASVSGEVAAANAITVATGLNERTAATNVGSATLRREPKGNAQGPTSNMADVTSAEQRQRTVQQVATTTQINMQIGSARVHYAESGDENTAYQRAMPTKRHASRSG